MDKYCEEVTVKGTLRLDVKEKLKEQLIENAFCDAILTVNDNKVEAHRCVLGAATPYFYTMFLGEFKEKRQQEVDLSQIFESVDTLKAIVDFIYGDELIVTEHSVADLLRAAEVLMMTEITELCLKFLIQNLTLQNCLWTWTMANLYSLTELEEICQDLATTRFHDTLVQSTDAMQLPPEFLKIFFEKGLAMHCTSEQIEEFLSNYLAADPDKRNESMVEDIREKVHKFDTKESSSSEQHKLDATVKDSIPEFEGREGWDNLPFKDIEDISFVLDENSVFYHTESTSDEEEADSFDAVDETTTEVLLFNDNKRCLLFNAGTKKWYQLCKWTEFGYTVVTAGIGKEHEFVLMKESGDSMMLMNLQNNNTFDLPPLPRKKRETTATTTNRRSIFYFCSNSQLYSLYQSVLSEEKSVLKSERPNQRSYYTHRESTKSVVLYLQRFDLQKWKWKFVGSMYEDQNTDDLGFSVLLHGQNEIYVFVVHKKVDIVWFDSSSETIYAGSTSFHRIYSHGTRRTKDEYTAYGSKSKICLMKQHDRLRIEYDLKLGTWQAVDLKFDFPTNQDDKELTPITVSHTRNESYFILKGAVDSIHHLVSFDHSTSSKKELPTIPGLTNSQTASVIRIPSQLLQCLEAPVGTSPSHEKVCKKSNIETIIQKFKLRTSTPTSKKEDPDESVDFFAALRQRMILQRLLGMDVGFADPFTVSYNDSDDEYHYYDDYDDYGDFEDYGYDYYDSD